MQINVTQEDIDIAVAMIPKLQAYDSFDEIFLTQECPIAQAIRRQLEIQPKDVSVVHNEHIVILQKIYKGITVDCNKIQTLICEFKIDEPITNLHPTSFGIELSPHNKEYI